MEDSTKMYIDSCGDVIVVLANGTEVNAGPAPQDDPEIIVIRGNDNDY